MEYSLINVLWVSAKGHPDRGADGARISLRRLLTLVDVVGQVTNRGWFNSTRQRRSRKEVPLLIFEAKLW